VRSAAARARAGWSTLGHAGRVPVVVTGADTPLGRAVVAALRADGVDVRATVRERSGRAGLAPPVAVMDLSDPLRFGAVLEGAHTLVHLDPAPLDHVLDAAEDTTLRRLVLVGGAVTAVPGTAVPGTGASGGGDLQVVHVTGDAAVADRAVVAAVVEADRRR
jgi:uncharacterized protein YbjT (DUF2867 family)